MAYIHGKIHKFSFILRMGDFFSVMSWQQKLLLLLGGILGGLYLIVIPACCIPNPIYSLCRRNNGQTNPKAAQCLQLLHQNDGNEEDFCGCENMVYRTLLQKPSSTVCQCELIKAKRKFNCSLMGMLAKFGLADNGFEEKKELIVAPSLDQKVFLLAADTKYFPSLKATIYDIKHIFGRDQKIIAYDLGGISEQKEMVRVRQKSCRAFHS